MALYILFGVLASIRTGGVNITVDLYQNFSECCQLLLEHTSRCRSIFDFHILLSGTAVELCVVLSSPKSTYTAHLIFNVRKRSWLPIQNLLLLITRGRGDKVIFFIKKFDFFISTLFIRFYANIDYAVIIFRFNVNVKYFIRLFANLSVYILRFW